MKKPKDSKTLQTFNNNITKTNQIHTKGTTKFNYRQLTDIFESNSRLCMWKPGIQSDIRVSR